MKCNCKCNCRHIFHSRRGLDMEHKQHFPPPAFLRCFLCSKLYADPKMLPCLHSFCKLCIPKEHCSKKILTCPLCRESFDISQKEVPRNIYLENRVNLYQEQSKHFNDPSCIFCKLNAQGNKEAVRQCITCLDLLCKVCSERHTSTTLTIDHQVIPITEIKSGKYDDAILLVKYKTYCQKHSDEEVWYFCKTCNSLICSVCIIKDHKGHDVDRVADLIKEKESETRKLCQELKNKTSELKQCRVSLTSRRNELKKWEEKKIAEIKKLCSEAVSKIERGKNQILNDLDNYLKQKSRDLGKGINNITAQCSNISDSVQYVEHVLNGMSAQKIFLFGELQGRLENLDKKIKESIPFTDFSEETENIRIMVTEPKLEMTLDKPEAIHEQTYENSAKDCSISTAAVDDDNDNSSDIFYVCDKAVQTSDVDFESFTEINNDQKRNYSLELLISHDLRTPSDKHPSYFTSVAWINENQFVAVDAGNAKVKICSFPLGTILNSTQVTKPLAVSAWKDGISCLTQENKMIIFSSELCPQNTLQNISSLCPSLPSSISSQWIENTTIVTKVNNIVLKLPLKSFPPNPLPVFFRYACSLPNGFYALSDMSNNCVYLVDAYGSIFKALRCNPEPISFDKFYNIFIADFQNSSMKVFDLKGNHLADLLLKHRPRSISILHDKLIVAAEFGSHVFVYDIIYR